ncbi:SMI1/KNR4 family protein [Butyrivibrio sp. INlla21]|uniref:SMI1/KNR4 family protein n=1 Tax=Butyrivibrio sp. INlla21 TaxID=1520811 RepID=UPI0008EF9BBB|nr:SMI1/KNR4 family protein [Butyrivibrio sp. INlla21]SFU44058.1 SMI1 / KNR4 family (SUKH-1) [Butyrivibrio sp. INlla21]
MNEQELLKEYNKSESEAKFESQKYNAFVPYVNSCYSGEGMIGENSYLMLWDKEDIEELNDDYEVNEFLNDSILIGSDGGDTAYGIDRTGRFFSVPFIGMSNDEMEYLGDSFTEFLEYLFKL